MRTAVEKNIDAAACDAALRTEVAAIAAEVIDNHPGPDARAMAEDVAAALMQHLRLHASGVYIAEHGEGRPTERFRSVTGRLDLPDDDD